MGPKGILFLLAEEKAVFFLYNDAQEVSGCVQFEDVTYFLLVYLSAAFTRIHTVLRNILPWTQLNMFYTECKCVSVNWRTIWPTLQKEKEQNVSKDLYLRHDIMRWFLPRSHLLYNVVV